MEISKVEQDGYTKTTKVTTFKAEEFTLQGYQECSNSTAIYPGKDSTFGLVYTVLGLAGEAGEVANKVKKILRDSNGVITPEVRESLKKEMGDVLWYVAQTCRELDLELYEVAILNTIRLQDRKERGVLKGSGDNR